MNLKRILENQLHLFDFEDGELSTLINLLKQLSERRVDAVRV